MPHSLSFDLQHDHILTKITLSSADTPKSTGASDTGLETKIPLDNFNYIVPLFACKIYS